MTAQIYYKLGLCPCGDAHSPFYLSVAKHGLPNGYYSVINSKIPDVVTIRLDPNGHAKEIESEDDEQVNDSINRHLIAQNILKTTKPPLPPSTKLKQSILQAKMANSVKNSQQNLTPARQMPNQNPLSPRNNDVFKPTSISLKAASSPNSSTTRIPAIKKQYVPVVNNALTITTNRAIPAAGPTESTQRNILKELMSNPVKTPQTSLAPMRQTPDKNPQQSETPTRQTLDENPQQVGTPTRQAQNKNPAQPINVFQTTNISLKPSHFPKPSSSKILPTNKQTVAVLQTSSTITSSRVVANATTLPRIKPSTKKKRAPLPPAGVVMKSPFKTQDFNSVTNTFTQIPPTPITLAALVPPPPPIPAPNNIANQTPPVAFSSDLLKSITSFNRNTLKHTVPTSSGEVTKPTLKNTGDPLEALRQKLTAIRPAHSGSDDEAENSGGTSDKEWIS